MHNYITEAWTIYFMLTYNNYVANNSTLNLDQPIIYNLE